MHLWPPRGGDGVSGRALVIGTGRIALGVAGELLHDAGWSVTFAGRNPDIVAALNRHRSYRLRLVSNFGAEDREIDGVDAIDVHDAAFAAAVMAADLIVTSVGAGNLAAVAALLAAPLRCRDRPIDILTFENHASPGDVLRAALNANDPDGTLRTRVGCAGALVSRAVSQVELDGLDGVLTVTGEPVRDVIIDASALLGPLPSADGFRAVTKFAAYVDRKLFVFSAGHATAAYLGQLKGYRFVHAAVRDVEIRRAVLEAMREGQQGIATRHGASFAAYAGLPGQPNSSHALEPVRAERALEAILDRFANASLKDPVARVGRDPRRKLASDDRLFGAAALAGRAGVAPRGLVLAAAAALCFHAVGGDPSASSLQHCVDRDGVSNALVSQCGLPKDGFLVRAVTESWLRLTSGGRPRSALLSIDQQLWA